MLSREVNAVMNKNLIGELSIMDSMDIKPNYAALGRKYGMDWRTVKKYHEGYQGKPNTRNKGSKLDKYKEEMADKLSIRRVSVRGVYEFLVKKYGIDNIGTYSNFNTYVNKNKLKPGKAVKGHPRYETAIGRQGQVDWKEDIKIASKYGEIFVINVFHIVLSFSKFSYLELSVQKRTDDVIRCLVNGFKKFGGVPTELLFDNMSTVAVVGKGSKRPTNAIKELAKEFNFKVRLCGTRKPETKGTVEARNKVIDWIRAYEGEFETLEDLIGIVADINSQMNIIISRDTEMSPTALFYKEKEYLQPLPESSVMERFLCPNKYRVSNEGLIRYAGRKYSVEAKLIGEEVTADILDDKLYIYYNGKLVTYHQLNEKPVNYKPEHYAQLMKGKVNESVFDDVVNENLKLMDTLLEDRTLKISPIEATASAEALIAYLNTSEYGAWIINRFAHLSAGERMTFIKGMNAVIPYVQNRDVFISHIKYSLKENLCNTLDFDCWVNDFMAYSENESILTEEGYRIIMAKYDKEITELIDDMKKEYEEKQRDNSDSDYIIAETGYIDPETGMEMPFKPKEKHK
jgi:transposase